MAEAAKIEKAVDEGRLGFRGDLEVVTPEFQPIVSGMNKTIDAFVKPIEVTADYVDRISRGDLPPKITDAYQGDFNAIKQNLNSCIETLNGLEADVNQLVSAAQEGRLAFRANAERHPGRFRQLVSAMNSAVATLVGHLDALPAPAFTLDRELRVRYMNTAALRVAGQSAEQVVGRRCAEIFKADDCNTERCACARAVAEGRTADGDTVVRPGQPNTTSSTPASPSATRRARWWAPSRSSTTRRRRGAPCARQRR